MEDSRERCKNCGKLGNGREIYWSLPKFDYETEKISNVRNDCMMSDFLISVIVPVYNIEKEYLERCIQSICDQTYQNLEILLVDDGATDGSGAVCDEFAKRDGRIRVFHKENGGSSSARNLGIQEAKGEYIGFIDSDDYIESDMYELLAEGITKHDVKMAQISRDEIDDKGNKLPDVCVPPSSEVLVSVEELMRELLMHRGDCSYCTRLSHKSLFENRRFPEGKLNEDFYLLVHMLTEVEKVVIIPTQCYHVFYRIGSNSRKKDKNDFSRVFVDIVENADMVTELVKQYYPILLEVAMRFGFYQRLDYLLHIPIAQMQKKNSFYCDVIKYLRKNIVGMLKNAYLTKKNKVYLFLLTIAPKITRSLHAKVRGL